MTSSQQVKDFYDTKFKDYQSETGVNVRHRTIFNNLLKIGLKPDSNVLEIGCGIGSVSGLILNYIKSGKLVALDISSESIKTAQRKYSSFSNVEFIENDMTNFSHSLKFDFIVFPDVLEHIPVEQHSNIFQTISKLSKHDAVVLINIPEPNHLNWLREAHPEKIQIIDQSLSIRDLLNSSYPSGFELYSVIPYSLYYSVNDYVMIIMKKNMKVKNVVLKNKFIRAFENFKSKLIL